MKKVTSLLLALVMALALAVPAFAEGTTIQPSKGEPSKNVEAKYTAPETVDGGKVYYFTVTWAENAKMDLAYAGENATYKWNGSTMHYEKTLNNESTAGWTGSAGYKVTITNQSNDDISATTEAEPNFNLAKDVDGTESLTLESAAKNITVITDTTTKGSPTSNAVTYTFSKAADNTSTAPTADNVTDGKVIAGKITVTVTHA